MSPGQVPPVVTAAARRRQKRSALLACWQPAAMTPSLGAAS